MPPTPTFLSPALPSELVSYILSHCLHPTTLIVCSPRSEFLSSLAADITNDGRQPSKSAEDSVSPLATHPLLTAPISHVAIARHIRLVFVPTVSHLRAFLAVFSPADTKIPRPPPLPQEGGTWGATATEPPLGKSKRSPLLLVYGLLDLHRGTSEWSAQGLASTAAALVEASWRTGFQAVMVEPRQRSGLEGMATDMLAEDMPLLSGLARRADPEMEEAPRAGRTVMVRRVLGRWFRFQDGQWESDRKSSHEGKTA